MKRYLTEEEKNIIIQKYDNGDNTYIIAESIGRNPISIQRYLKKAGYTNLIGKGNLNRRTKYKLDLTKFKSHNEFSDYWAGFIAADGCINNPKKGKLRLIININDKDKEHLEKFNIGYPVINTKRNSVYISIPSNELAAILKDNYNITERKSETLKYPNLKNNSHFIRGYFDGDGGFSISKRGRLRAYMVGTYNFLNEVSKILPCKNYMYPTKNKNIYTMYISEVKNEMALFIEFIYKNSEIYLERKKELSKLIK